MSLRETIITAAKAFIAGLALFVGGTAVVQGINANPTRYGLIADGIDLIGKGVQMANEILAFATPLI